MEGYRAEIYLYSLICIEGTTVSKMAALRCIPQEVLLFAVHSDRPRTVSRCNVRRVVPHTNLYTHLEPFD
jgi:hypothetical protein